VEIYVTKLSAWSPVSFRRGISVKDFFSLSKRVDPKIKYISSIKGVQSIPLILEVKHSIDSSIKRKLLRIGFKTKYEINFINHICGNLPIRNLDSLKALVEISRIYYDNKASLMGKTFASADGHNSNFMMKSQLLNGKGISIGFIDTGIHPRADFMKPRRRILSFKDFVNGKKDAYDDSGHGTSSAATASIPAGETGIVCAKAFNMINYGYYSDILASMDWMVEIKDKYNIKIVVLNFGVSLNSGNHDILSIAAEALWQKGLLVISCAGNLGPEKSTITSPGHNGKLLTIGSFDTDGAKFSISPWSSKGPVAPNLDKPDIVMPGFIPSESFMGTAASASLAAGFAALVYEKKKDISPDDVKSLLKLCTTSLGELKHAQGKGYMNIKKIEEL